jgi:hypothetical protein
MRYRVMNSQLDVKVTLDTFMLDGLKVAALSGEVKSTHPQHSGYDIAWGAVAMDRPEGYELVVMSIDREGMLVERGGWAASAAEAKEEIKTIFLDLMTPG